MINKNNLEEIAEKAAQGFQCIVVAVQYHGRRIPQNYLWIEKGAEGKVTEIGKPEGGIYSLTVEWLPNKAYYYIGELLQQIEEIEISRYDPPKDPRQQKLL